ncbi:MAG: glycosyltransferase family 2 protein [Candidatus Doudnabacteria bacterium]|nr:glycosyltransferase family 2 protein [Candidatus Doudnabacteria bacterium]
MDLSIVIVNFNTKKLLQKCLESVFASQTNCQFEVLVSDNGSVDGSVEMVKAEFPKVKLLENKANLGFAKGNNAALKQASGRYILLLNSDTEVRPDTFDLSIKYMDSHSNVGALSPKILLPNGELDQAARRKFPNPWNSFLRLFGFKQYSDYNATSPIDEEVEIDSGVGAYLMVRKSVIDQVGLLDEQFFMYGEDLDWCWRIKEAGYKVMYYPKPVVIHYKYGSAQAIAFRTIKSAHQAMKIFYRKHYANQYPWLFNQLVYLGINLRMYLVLVLNLFRSKKRVH